MNARFLALPFAALIFATPAQAQDRGALLSNPCAGCHGPDGMSQSDIPNISGMDAAGIEMSLKAFKSEEIQGTIMSRIAKGYSDEDIALIAATMGKK